MTAKPAGDPKGFGAVIGAMDFGADVHFCFELGGRLEEVLEPEQLFA